MMILDDIKPWKEELGLLPIRLFSCPKDNKYILLNGSIGNFCIDFDESKTTDDYFSYAWSCNTKNYVTISKNKVNLYNWLKRTSENYNADLIINNLQKFYQYLIQKSCKSEYDIVPFVIDIYKKLRNLTHEVETGIQALGYLFLILAAYEENCSFDAIDRKKWKISDNIIIDPKLDNYFNRFATGIKGKLKPNVELIIRHAAGELFQEAQKETIFFNRRQDLFGLYTSSYQTSKLLFSSFHYTPSFLARTIVEFVLSKIDLSNKQHIKILDPACGTSEFLLEVLKQLKTIGYQGNVEIHAWDSSESAIRISEFLLAYEQREWRDNLTIYVKKVKDSLIEVWDHDYDIILMNPPFLSWELMDKEEREIVSEILKNTYKKKPNLASAFIYKSIFHLKDGGIIGTIMPSSFLTMDSYKKLRDMINESLSLLLIGKLGNYVFENALTDISILIGQKPKSKIVPLLLWTKNEQGIISDALRDLRKINYRQIPYVKKNKKYSIYEPDIYPDRDNWKVISYQDQFLKKRLQELVLTRLFKTVREIFNVKQGIRTGNNKVFKISKEFYDGLSSDEKKYFRPVVDNNAVKNGLLNIVNYVWFPYSDKKEILITEEQELSIKVPTYYKKCLLPNKENLKKRKKKVPYWWCLSDYAPRLLPNTIKLVSTEFGHSGSFAFDEKGEFVVERGNAWIPKKEFKNKDYYYFYLAIFNSTFFDKLLSIYSKELLKGYDLGKKYTADIPIPIINDKLKNNILFELIEFGKQIAAGEFFCFEMIDDLLKKYIYKV
jgi:type I restriction-modification system DNA methylase subunit